MTNIDVCADVIDNYIRGLSAEFDATPSDNGCFLLTPFDRPDGEGIELEVEHLPNGQIRINDMGDTFGYLYVNGITLSRTILDKAKRISWGHGISLESASLSVEVELTSTGDALHRLIQSVLSTTDLIHTRHSTSTNKTRFDDAVESFIIYKGVTYDAKYLVKGKRESHEFRFHVDSGRNLLIQPITASTEAPAHSWAERWAYRFLDITQANEGWRPVALLDDRKEQNVWTPYTIAPIEEYAILWAEREKLGEMLAGDVD